MDKGFGQESQAQHSAIDSQDAVSFEEVTGAIQRFNFLKKTASDAIKNIADFEETDQAYQGAVEAASKNNKGEAITQGAIVIRWLSEHASQLKKFEKQ